MQTKLSKLQKDILLELYRLKKMCSSIDFWNFHMIVKKMCYKYNKMKTVELGAINSMKQRVSRLKERLQDIDIMKEIEKDPFNCGMVLARNSHIEIEIEELTKRRRYRIPNSFSSTMSTSIRSLEKRGLVEFDYLEADERYSKRIYEVKLTDLGIETAKELNIKCTR